MSIEIQSVAAWILTLFNNYLDLVDDILRDAARSKQWLFNTDNLVGPAGTNTVVLAPSIECKTKFYANQINWVKISQFGPISLL